MVQPARPILSLLPPGNIKVRFFVPQATLPQASHRRPDRRPLRRLRRRSGGARQLHLRAGRVHAAGHLQPGGAGAAGLSHRGDPGAPERPARRPARRDAPRKCGASAMPASRIVTLTRRGGARRRHRRERLTKSFGGRVVVRNLSMRVRRGQIFGFLGPTAPARPPPSACCAACSRPTAGAAPASASTSAPRASKIKQRVGYMTQHFSLYQDLSILENLEFVARVYGLADPRQGGARRDRPPGPRGPREQMAGKLPAAGSSAWRSAPASCPSPNCCCSTSRPPASTPRRGASSGARSTSSRPTASPFSSPPTTWTRPSAATRSPISPTASCWRRAPSRR